MNTLAITHLASQVGLLWAASSGFTPDSLLSAGSALVAALIATSGAAVVALWQNHSGKRERDAAAAIWQKQAEELSERVERQHRSEHQRDRELIDWHVQRGEADMAEIRRLNTLLQGRIDDGQ